MKFENDFVCSPIREGHVYKMLNETGWMTVTNYELDNGVFVNLMYAEIDELSNRDQVDEMNYYGLPIVLHGAAEMLYDDGTKYTYLPGSAVFGIPLNKRLNMRVTSHSITGITLITSLEPGIPRIGGDPCMREIVSDLRDRLGIGMDRPIRVPLEIMVVSESVRLELESNRCRDQSYIGKRVAQMFHMLYRTEEFEFMDPPDTKDDAAVDRICCILTEDFSKRRTVKEVCESEEVDQFWFINNFRRRYGMTPTAYILLAKHIHAAALLLTEKYTVAEVMGMVGYTSGSMFLKAFRKVHGCNPKHYVETFDSRVESYPEFVCDEN